MDNQGPEAEEQTGKGCKDSRQDAEGGREETASSSAAAASPPIRKEGGTAIVVPYRDLHPEQQRARHLQHFLERLPKVLEGHAFHIYIVEQSKDNRKFNRGKLLNIGFKLAEQDGREVFVLHDVDLVPSMDLALYYTQRAPNPIHIARVWSRYSGNPKYIGGAVAFSAEDFTRINGFPNTFWGWGGEDDEMRKRIDEEKLEVGAPQAGSMEDMEEQSLEQKLKFLRKHRDWKCNVKWEALNEHAATWKGNGLSNLDYELLAKEPLGPHATKFTVDVKLNDHWTDTVHEIQQTSEPNKAKRGKSKMDGHRNYNHYNDRGPPIKKHAAEVDRRKKESSNPE